MLYAIQCPNCGVWQGKEIRKLRSSRFVCKYCNKGRKFKKENQFGLSVTAIRCDNGKKLSELIKRNNEAKQ